MSSDEVVTWYDVAQWLPKDIRTELTMAQPPEQRGWYTEEEMQDDGGRFVEITMLSSAERRFLKC